MDVENGGGTGHDFHGCDVVIVVVDDGGWFEGTGAFCENTRDGCGKPRGSSSSRITSRPVPRWVFLLRVVS